MRLADWLHAHGSPALTTFLLAVTHLHSMAGIGLWSVIFAVVLAKLRERYWILTLAVTVAGAMLVNLLLKQTYERVRPRFEEPLLVLDTFSFPSGHTSAVVAFYGVLAAFLVSRFYGRRRRAACVAGALLAIGLVAFSRLYLGAHYLSDVVAAICSSTVWLVLCLAAGHALVRGRLKLRWIALGAGALVALALATILPLEDWSHELAQSIDGMGLVAGLALFGAIQVLATLLLVPAWIFPLAAGAVFGMGWGLAVALGAALASALAAFLLARTLLRRRVERAARRSEVFKRVAAAVSKDPWKVVALARMSPLLPSGLKSYFLGLTRVRLADYATASAAGMLPGILLKVYVGAAGRDAFSEGGPFNWTLFAAGIAATLALTALLGRKVRL